MNLSFVEPIWFRSAPIDFPNRLEYFSKYFVNVKYHLNPLGEDIFDRIDQDPLYRFDQFDCMTYVETVIALSRSRNWSEFERKIIDLRYINTPISFANRHHFVESTWIASAQEKGFVKDVTNDIASNQMRKISKQIDVRGWIDRIQPLSLGFSLSDVPSRSNLIQNLESEKILAEINYISKEQILKNPELLKKIPTGSIVFFLVGKNSKFEKQIGTDLLVFHSGLVFQTPNSTQLRHASSRSRSSKVVIDDLHSIFLDESRMPNVLGIHVEKIQSNEFGAKN